MDAPLTHLMPTHKPLPITVSRAEGVWVWDTDGNTYLDTYSGLAVLPLGHAHPKVNEAITTQLERFGHLSNTLRHPLNEQLAETLATLTGMDSVFFCNSGAESCEAALKLARRYGHQRGTEDPKVLVFDQGYHGRTLATLSASGFRWAHAGFEPLVRGFTRAPYGDLKAVKEILEQESDIVAILVEPILGAGGVQVPPADFLPGLRALCDAHECLLICDEIQCGLGRTGAFLECVRQQVTPDIVTIAKGLANGLPIGACLAKQSIANLFTPGSHGSTFGGNPISCAAALATLNTLTSERLIPQAQEKGDYFLQRLREHLVDHTCVESIRGQGLMVGVVLHEPIPNLALQALKAGLLLNIANKRIIRLLPALIISDEQLDAIAEKLSTLLPKD